MLADPTPCSARCSARTLPYSRTSGAAPHRRLAAPVRRGRRASWNFRRRRRRRVEGVTVTYDLTRLQRLPTDTHYLVTLGGDDLVDPATVIARREYAHPLYTPTSVAARARLPQISTDRVAFAGAYHGWGFHEDGARSYGCRRAARPALGRRRAGGRGARFLSTLAPLVPLPTSPRASRPPHVRRALPTVTGFRGSCLGGLRTSTSGGRPPHPGAACLPHDDQPHPPAPVPAYVHPPLAHLARRPRRAARPTPRSRGGSRRFEARDHLGDPDRSLRANVEPFLADHGVALDGEGRGRVLMAAMPRAFGNGFDPISVFWCFAPEHRAMVVEVRNTYGDRHAYVVHPDEQARPYRQAAVRLPVPRDRRPLRARGAGPR